jgi:peptide/nickel transport system substrate-binding protein
MRKFLVPVCAALLGGASVAAAETHDTLTLGIGQFPPDMHPYITNSSMKDYIRWPTSRVMTWYTRGGQVMCLLCTEVPSVANGRAKVVDRPDGTKGMQVTFTLKPGLSWGDGVPVTARDFVFAFDVYRAFSAPQQVDGVVAVDDRTLRVDLNRTRYDFDRWAYAPLPEHIEGPIFRAAANPLDYGQKSALNRHPENPGLWMGPYRIAEFRPNESVVMVPNEHWQGTRPHFRQVTMRLIDNTSALQANLLAGDIDTVASGNLGLTMDQIIALSKSQASRFNFAFMPAVTSYEHLAVQLDNPLLADKRVRQAIQMSIDRKTIVAKLFENHQELANSFMHPSQAGWDSSVRTWPFDPRRARALLAEAGFKPGADGILVSPTGERFSIDLTTTAGNRTRELVEQVLQTQLKAVGIEVVVKNEPARVMFGETLRKRSFRGFVEFQADPQVDWVPDFTFHSAWIPSAANNWSGTNYMGYRSPEMDAAIAAAQNELDPAKRKAVWKRILDIAAEDLPEIDLYFASVGYVLPKWLDGVVHDKPDQMYGTGPGWIEEWHAAQ